MSFFEDFKKINKLNNKQLESFVAFLNSSSFLKNNVQNSLEFWSRENNIDFDLIKSCFSAINFLIIQFIIDKGYKQGIDIFENEILDIAQNQDSEIKLTWDKLKKYIRKLDNFSLKIKSKKIATRYPLLEEFMLTCDIRPVFDIDRDKIHHFQYPIIITMKTSNQEKDMILECDEQDLIDLHSEIKKALEKIQVIKRECKLD